MSKLLELIATTPKKADAIVRKAAFTVEMIAKINTPKDTTALESSIYTKTSQSDDYAQAAAAAASKRPGVETAPIPESARLGQAFVGPCVLYGIYQELGTYKMAAHPFMYPAIEQVGDRWESDWVELFE
jgi:HK97 gp10 family phage protein